MNQNFWIVVYIVTTFLFWLNTVLLTFYLSKIYIKKILSGTTVSNIDYK